MSDSYRPSSGKADKGPWRLVVGIVAVLIAVFFMVWWNSAMETPKLAVPTPVMPTPNAFDAYVSAGSMLLDDKKIGYAISDRHASGDKNDHVYTLADEEKLVTENAKTLATLRQGLDREYLNPPARSFNALFPYYARFRSLARLKALESMVKAQKGDWAGSVNCNLDAVEMGEQIPHGSVLIGGLVGEAIQAIGRRPVWGKIDHLDAKEARAEAQRLEKIQSRHFPMAETFQEEKWFGQAGLLQMLQSQNFSSALNGANPGNGTPIPRAVSQLFFLAYSKRRILNDYTTYMDAEIARMRQPYAAKPAATPIPNNPIMQALLPVYESVQINDVEGETQNGLLLVSLALRAYYAEHHAYPPTLNELVPHCLTRLPADPFALNGTFKYKRTGNKYVLYSVGPDGKDDGGKPIDTGASRSSSPNERYFIKAGSTGDVVVGVNKW